MSRNSASVHRTHLDLASKLKRMDKMRNTGRAVQATKAIPGILAACRSTLGADHPKYGEALLRCTQAHQDAGDVPAAVALAKESLGLTESNMGMGTLTHALQLGRLGILMQESGDHAGSESYLLRAITDASAHLGQNHPDLCRQYANMARHYDRMGSRAAPQARRFYTQAYESSVCALGAAHHLTNARRNDLGMCLRRQGDLEAAEPLLEEVLRVAFNDKSSDYMTLAVSCNNLAVLCRSQANTETRVGVKVSKVRESKDYLLRALKHMDQGAEAAKKKALEGSRGGSPGGSHGGSPRGSPSGSPSGSSSPSPSPLDLQPSAARTLPGVPGLPRSAAT